MPNLFDTFSLGSYFSVDATTRSLNRVSSAITSGTASFDRILLNDEDIRERARVHKEGVDFDRERLSSLIGKVQQLQARLQASYQSMLDRQLSTNSAEVGTNHEITDKPIFVQDNWKSVGRGALLFSKAARADTTVPDTWSAGPNNLGRLTYFRPDAAGNLYQERGSYFSTLNYLWGFDLHQLRYTYATGTIGPGTVAGAMATINNDQLFEMDAIDFNKVSNINWKLGDIIKVDPVKVFTPEFQAIFGGVPNKFGDILYKNGSGYQFQTGGMLYAYVREVDILPDGVTKPRIIDLIRDPFVIDANLDEVPDNVIRMNDFLTSIMTDDIDLTLRGDQWNGNTAPGAGEALAPGVTAGQGWKPWNGETNPPRAGAGPGSIIWSGNSTGPQSSFHTTRVMGVSGEIDVLKHSALTYKGFANAYNDDDGMFFWTQAASPGGDPDTWGGAGNGAVGWTRSGADLGGGPTTWDIANGAGIQSLQMTNNKDISFSYTGRNAWGWSGTTNSSGQNLEGVLQIKKIAGQSSDQRYTVDRFGNIYDKYGIGNTAADHYDYIPNILDNAKGNYVGNIFGNNTRVGRKVELDGNRGRTTNNDTIDSNERNPMLEFASRDFDHTDDSVILPGTSTVTNPESGVTYRDKDIKNVDTYNPQFAEVFLGFSDATQTTLGFGSGRVDGFGNRMNQIQFQAFRSSDSIGAHTNGIDWLGQAIGGDTVATVNAANRDLVIDRDYTVMGVGTKVQITDNASGVVAGFGNPPITTGTITAFNTVTRQYTVAHDDPAISLDPQRRYTITTVPNPDPRLAGSMENSFVSAIKTILSGSEYKEAIRAGLMDDLMLSASTTDAYGDMMSGKLTVRYNKKQERVELFQNSFAAFYKSGP